MITTEDRLDQILRSVRREVLAALAKHGSMHSPHEGISVIKEEVDELWEHVKADTGSGNEARKEALQIAAMGVRYQLDICDYHEQ